MGESQQQPLFGGGEDAGANACLNWTRDQWWLYASGYHRAVEVLVKHVADNNGDLDSLVYPIVFSARHSIELSLKHLHRDCCSLLEIAYRLPSHHAISSLWQMVKPLVREAFPDEDFNSLASVDEFALALSEVDRGSTVFRYPVDREGNASIDPTVRYLNVRDFFARYDAAARMLESVHIAVGEAVDYRRESEADFHFW